MNKKFTAPAEEVFFTRIHVRRDLELVGSLNKFSIFFIDLAEQVMQISRVLLLQQTLNLLCRQTETTALQVSLRQIVTVIVRRRSDTLRLFQKGSRLCD